MPIAPRARLNAAKARQMGRLRPKSGAPFSGGGGSGWGRIRTLLPGAQYDVERQVGDPARNSAVASCLRWILNNANEPKLEIVRTKGKGHRDPIEGHPLLRLVSGPYPTDGLYPRLSPRMLWGMVALACVVDGNGYWLKIRSASGKVVRVWPLWPQFMSPDYPQDGSRWLDGWNYRINGVDHFLPAEDVVHFQWGMPDPLNDRLFVAPLKSAFREVATDNDALGYGAALLRNGGVPGLAIVPTGPDMSFTVEQARELKQLWREGYTADNRGDVFVATGPVKLEQITWSPEQLALDRFLRLHESRITATIGLPPQVVGLLVGNEAKTHANWEEARRAAYEDFLIPFQKALAETIQSQLLPDLVGDALAATQLVGWDYSEVQCLSESETEKVDRAVKLLASGGIKRSVFLAAIGEPATAADDVYYLPRGVTVVDADHNPVVTAPDLQDAGIDDEADDDAEGVEAADDDGGKAPDVTESAAVHQAVGAGKSVGAGGDDRRPFAGETHERDDEPNRGPGNGGVPPVDGDPASAVGPGSVEGTPGTLPRLDRPAPAKNHGPVRTGHDLSDGRRPVGTPDADDDGEVTPADVDAAVAWWDRHVPGHSLKDATDPRALLEMAIAAAKDELTRDAERLQSGEINAAEWALRSEAVVKKLTVAAGVLAEGGRSAMTPAAYGRIGARVKAQLGYLDGFARDVEAGRQPMDGRLLQRVGLYAASAVTTYEAVRRANTLATGGHSRERRLVESDDPCEDCQSYAGLGWVDVGTLPDIGDSCACHSNCRCRFEYL